jgi:hypothetical protein
VLIAEPTAAAISAAVRRVADRDWDTEALATRARRFSRERFVSRMRELVFETMRSGRRLESVDEGGIG